MDFGFWTLEVGVNASAPTKPKWVCLAGGSGQGSYEGNSACLLGGHLV